MSKRDDANLRTPAYLVQAVTDLLAEPDEDDLSPADLAKVERAAAS